MDKIVPCMDECGLREETLLLLTTELENASMMPHTNVALHPVAHKRMSQQSLENFICNERLS